MKQAFVNGEPISQEAVQFELDRLVKFYATHGMSQAEIKSNLEKLVEKAQEQAIGAKLLLARAEQLDLPVPDAAIAVPKNARLPDIDPDGIHKVFRMDITCFHVHSPFHAAP